MEDVLPEGWKWVELKEVCDIVTGTTPPKSDATNYGSDIPFFKPPHLWDSAIIDTDEKLSLSGAKKSRVVPPNTVLVTCIGNLGRTGITKTSAAFNQQINAIIENDRIAGKYIFYQAQSPAFRKQLDSLATGTTVSIVNKGNFETIKIPLAPPQTQNAIVTKIEELFSEIDKGIETLRTAQQQLKVYRQAVLKCAFEGRLTGSHVKEDDLPINWKLKTIGDVFEVFVGSTPKRNNPKYWNGDINWVSSGEVDFRNIASTKERISVEGLNATSCKVHPIGTVIIAMIGEGKTRGQAAVLKVEASHNQNTAAIRVDCKTYRSTLLYYYLLFKYQDNRKAGSGNNQKALNKARIKEIFIPVPPIEEQGSIIIEIESRLSVADKIEESIAQSLQQAEALKQSILKRIFLG